MTYTEELKRRIAHLKVEYNAVGNIKEEEKIEAELISLEYELAELEPGK